MVSHYSAHLALQESSSVHSMGVASWGHQPSSGMQGYGDLRVRDQIVGLPLMATKGRGKGKEHKTLVSGQRSIPGGLVR